MYISKIFKPTTNTTKGYSKEEKEIHTSNDYKNYTYKYYITNWNTFENGLEYILGSYETVVSKYCYKDSNNEIHPFLTSKREAYLFNDIVNGEWISNIKKNYQRNIAFIIDVKEEDIPSNITELNLILNEFENTLNLGTISFSFKQKYNRPINLFINEVYQDLDFDFNNNTVRCIIQNKNNNLTGNNELYQNDEATDEIIYNSAAENTIVINASSFISNNINIKNIKFSNKTHILQNTNIEFNEIINIEESPTLCCTTTELYFNNVNLTPTDNIITIQSLELNTITYSSEFEKNFNIIGKTI